VRAGGSWATGSNERGYLELGDVNGATRFERVPLDVPVTAVSTSSTHTLAVGTDGSLWGSGISERGQFGFESGDGNDLNTFTKLSVDAHIISAHAGSWWSSVQADDHTLWVAGANTRGQLGLGDHTRRDEFTPVVATLPDDLLHGWDGRLGDTRARKAVVADIVARTLDYADRQRQRLSGRGDIVWADSTSDAVDLVGGFLETAQERPGAS
jgi:hypothetical protein